MTDALCDADPVLQSKHGDGTPNFLNPGDTWSYTCSHATTTSTTGNIHNVADVTGTDEAGDVVTDTDPADTTVNPGGCTVNCNPPPPPPPPPPGRNPAITIVKTGPATAPAASPIPYTLDVTNTGDQAFPDAQVVLTDALCNAAPTLTTKNGDPTPSFLHPGETWTYVCSVPTALGQSFVHNVGSVTGTDTSGDVVTATDDADTTLLQGAVLGLQPATSSLRGPSV